MTKKHLVVALLIAGILSVSATIYMAWPKEAQQPQLTSDAETSMFSTADTTDWTQGPSSRTDMVLFAPKADDETSGCFTSIEYKSGSVNPATQASQTVAQYEKDGLPLAQLTQTSQTLASNTTPLDYTLTQYRIDSSGGDSMQGLALGYVSLETHHIEIESHCETAEALVSTIPALNSYIFHAP